LNAVLLLRKAHRVRETEDGMEMKAEGLKKLDTDGLLELRDRIDEVLSYRRHQLEAQLERITGQPKLRIAPRYRSKKNPNVTWSGRGMLPRWMRQEMQGTKLNKEDFRISP
jgi:DNA-binding protein H-NS